MAAEALEQSMLESKDKDQLLAIAQALGIKTNARAAKATLISKILETTGVGPAAAAEPSAASQGAGEAPAGPDGEPLPDWEAELVDKGEVAQPAARAAANPVDTGHAVAHDDAGDDDAGDDDGGDGDDDGDGDRHPDGDGDGDGESRNARRRRRRRNKNRTGDGTQPGDGAQPGERQEPRERNDRPERNDRAPRPDRQDRGERSEGSDQFSLEPVQVAGYLDLREEGYGFLRVNGYLASRDDAYIPV